MTADWRRDDDTNAEARPGAKRVVSWGELLWDSFPDGPRLGGAAANVAWHVAALGDDVALVSRVGADELGREATRRLAAYGVDTRSVQVDPESPTGTVRVEFERGEPRFSIVEHVAWDRIRWDASVAELVSRADVLCYSTLAQRTALGSGALRAALEAVKPTCITLCDLNLRPPFERREVVEASLATAAVVKLNEREAERLAELFDAADPVAWLLDRGVRCVALTRAERGSLLATPQERWEHPGVPISSTGGDPVGAGDAFVATLAHHLARGTPLPQAQDHANRVASFVASQPGGMPELPDALRRP